MMSGSHSPEIRNWPEWWEDDDRAIAQLLDELPVPDSSRLAVHQRLLQLSSSSPNECEPNPGLNQASSHESQPLSKASAWQLPAISRRMWVSAATLAASLLLGLFWWNAAQSLTVEQLIAVSIDQVASSHQWTAHPKGVGGLNADLTELQALLNVCLRVPIDESLQYREIVRTKIAQHGRLWKLQLQGGKELFVVEFYNPRKIQTINNQLRILTGPSNGWATAAVTSGDRLFVFMSRSELSRSLRLTQLA